MTLHTQTLPFRDNTSRRGKPTRLFVAGSISAAAAIGIALSSLPPYAVAIVFTGAASLYALRLRHRD